MIATQLDEKHMHCHQHQRVAAEPDEYVLQRTPPHFAQAAGEAEESEEAGKGGDEVGGGNVVGREADMMTCENCSHTLNGEKDAR